MSSWDQWHSLRHSGWHTTIVRRPRSDSESSVRPTQIPSKLHLLAGDSMSEIEMKLEIRVANDHCPVAGQ